MKRFLAIYIGTEAALERAQWKRLDEETRKAREVSGVKAWMEWGTANSAAVVDQGHPLGKTKRASPEGLRSGRIASTGDLPRGAAELITQAGICRHLSSVRDRRGSAT